MPGLETMLENQEMLPDALSLSLFCFVFIFLKKYFFKKNQEALVVPYLESHVGDTGEIAISLFVQKRNEKVFLPSGPSYLLFVTIFSARSKTCTNLGLGAGFEHEPLQNS